MGWVMLFTIFVFSSIKFQKQWSKFDISDFRLKLENLAALPAKRTIKLFWLVHGQPVLDYQISSLRAEKETLRLTRSRGVSCS